MTRRDPQTPPTLEARLAPVEPELRAILERALEGRVLSVAEGEALFGATGPALDALVATADRVRAQAVGERVTFVVNRNINFSNVCYMGCRFCGFARRIEDGDAELLSLAEVARRAREAWDRGATEVCIQGGLDPRIDPDHYRQILVAIKETAPDIHIHAFSPFEIWWAAKRRKVAPEAHLRLLREHGLGTIPGTAAEILDTEVRQKLTRNKLSAEDWVAIIKAAHGVGLRSTATIMYGHVDGPAHWAAHLGLIRDIQRETGGFTEFVPLGFVHTDSPLYVTGGARPGPTPAENLRMHAVSRLMLAGFIDNIQASWVKLGPPVARTLLGAGVNDLGGTLMNESISRAAGSRFGQEVTPAEMVALIRAAGRVPAERTTLYQILETFDTHSPAPSRPLVARTSDQLRAIARATAAGVRPPGDPDDIHPAGPPAGQALNRIAP